MKIGILTIHDSPNYGACLQCYALWEYLNGQGYDCEVIDLHRPGAHPDYIPSKRYMRCRPLKQSNFTKLKNFVKQVLGKRPKPIEFYNEESKKKFDAFNSLYRKSQSYLGPDELYKTPPDYDVYIAGSDQLWNPTQSYSIEPYFLTFVDGKVKKKVSFATSIGITELRDIEKEQFRRWLTDFTAISVRERQAKELLNTFVERDINVVADPSFLLDASTWADIAKYPHYDNPYILYIALHKDNQLLDYCKRLSKESGLDLYVLRQTQPKPIHDEYVAIKDAGPQDLIGYIADADMVITDSFHGTVFSIIMGAQNFYTYISEGNKRGSRIEDLLELFSLKNHIIREKSFMPYKELQEKKPDRKSILSVIDKERAKSIAFLKNAIGESHEH